MQSSLLGSEERGGVFAGVKLFPSSYANTWNEIRLFASAFALFALSVLLLFTGAFAWILIVCLFTSALVVFAIGKAVQKEAVLAYESSVKQSTWQEGIFVFPTKDVVVRFHRPGFHCDREFASGAITTVWASETRLEISARNELTCTVKATDLAQPTVQVAEEMRQLLGISSIQQV